ncbi:hypothetical protein E1301_Tti008946 [Triplophysa tibetana]|uniref:Uncharacterized protein n=1 Tax=Triplophysa tibetana TaxID=1572043 RepID=A0A5A9P6C3_9TELE|nr:hypothetical protein E1301_Tti008946 [Triplophysa tibetana]
MRLSDSHVMQQVGLGKPVAVKLYLRLCSHAGLSAEEAESCAPARHSRLQQQQQESGGNAAHQPGTTLSEVADSRKTETMVCRLQPAPITVPLVKSGAAGRQSGDD